MQIKKISAFSLFWLIPSLYAVSAQQQKIVERNDTLSAYKPEALFSPVFYTSSGNERNAPDGAPGAAYWQNRCNYHIKAALDTAQNTLTAYEYITYINNSPDSLSYVWLQLDQNTYRADARSNFNTNSTPGEHTRGYTLDSVFIQNKNGLEKAEYLITDTRMQLRLRHVIPPKGGRLKIFIRYQYTIPAAFGGRTDYVKTKNGKIFEIAQWFPRMCVYDAGTGWNTLPFLGVGEFYLEYGDIDYQVTAPWNMILAGSGELMNPKEVLTAQQISRLDKAANSDHTMMIRSPEELGNPKSRPKQKGNLTWHFRMFNTRDVAFGASSAYIWDAAAVRLPEGKKCMAMSVYPVESMGAEAWGRATEYLKASLEYFSRQWFVYPYPVAVNQAGAAGGMEYPGIVFDGWLDKGKDLYAVTAHEIGHNWFPMIVGSDERRFPWMDEGFNTFIDVYASDDFQHGEYGPKRDPEYAANGGNPAQEILPILSDRHAPVITTTADAVDETYRHPVIYFKTAFGLVLLREQILGRERFDYAFKTYIRAWAYRHPGPDDFFRCMENASGENLSWFWREWFYHNWEFDIAIADAKYTSNDYAQGVDIHLINKKQMAFPCTLELRFKNGTNRRMTIPVESWNRRKEIHFHSELSSPLEKIILDPDAALPDGNRENNVLQMAQRGSAVLN
ncbi:MAG: M1 family metallopeptidase [Bacteroidota bacterium]|nr:M1 family metallopeptidase [Bacteroidota bacterium]